MYWNLDILTHFVYPIRIEQKILKGFSEEWKYACTRWPNCLLKYFKLFLLNSKYSWIWSLNLTVCEIFVFANILYPHLFHFYKCRKLTILNTFAKLMDLILADIWIFLYSNIESSIANMFWVLKPKLMKSAFSNFLYLNTFNICGTFVVSKWSVSIKMYRVDQNLPVHLLFIFTEQRLNSCS